MSKALIDPNALIYDYASPPNVLGYRVCQVATATFEVAAPLFWVDCDNTIIADKFYWANNAFYPVPVMPAYTESALISPNDKVYDTLQTPPILLGYRIAAVSTIITPAPIPMYWVPCADNITPNGFYYTGYGFVAY